MCAEKLALYGGEKLKSTPFGAGNRFGENDLHHLKEALEQGTLFYWYGDKVKSLTKKFAEIYDMPYCVAASSGTAAVHVALGICGVTAGDEVITSPITDMGTIIGILFQKGKISKTKGFNKDGNTKNKKYHHQEDSNNEITLKTKRLQTFQRTLSTLIGYLCNRKGVYKERVTI